MTATNPPLPAERTRAWPFAGRLLAGIPWLKPGPAPSRPANRSRLRRLGGAGWLSAALLAVAPKCGLCLLSYLGLAAALGFGGPELCGATRGSATAWLTWLSGLGLALGAIAVYARLSRDTVLPTRDLK
jgi:hypothetical protein